MGHQSFIRIFEKPECVVDIIYNPIRTKLMEQAQKRGIKAVNGITAQGSQNGDMDGNGITNADALAIQMDILNVR